MRKKITSEDDRLPSRERLRTIRTRGYRAGLSANDASEVNALMGEVRVKVKLTNAGDEVLVRRGLLGADQVRHYEADALVDTGAVRSVLPIHVVQQLGLAIVGTTRATYANDGTEDVDIAEVTGIEVNGRRTTEETLVLGSEVLIGQTVLESLDLLVDCTNQRVIPNPAHPDQPVIKIKLNLLSGRAALTPKCDEKNKKAKKASEEIEFVVTQEDYQVGINRGWMDDDMLKPGLYKMKRGGFLERHPELKLQDKKRA